MQPISQNNQNIHKGPSSSTEFNEIRNQIHYDLMSLFIMANRHEEEIKDNMDVLLREIFFLQNKITELEGSVEKIGYDFSYKKDGIDKQRLIKSFYNIEGLSDGDLNKQALVDTTYGYLSIPASDVVSKISQQSDTKQVVIPESLELKILESNNTQPLDPSTGMRQYYLVEDDNTKLACDRDKNTFWVHTSSFPGDSGISEVYGILHIKLPLDTLNNLYANTLTLNTFPSYSMTIRDIQYKGYGEQWFRLPNYPTEKDVSGAEVPVSIENSSKLLFSFPKTEITEVQILFAQPYWFANETRRDFTYGFQEISLENRIYNANLAEIVSEFSLENTTKSFYVIDQPSVTPVKTSEKNIGDLIEHKLYYNRDLTNEFSFGNEIMAPIKKIYVKTIIKGAGDSIPFIKNINLDFTFKEDEE